VAGLLGVVAEAYPGAGTPAGSVMVQRLRRPDGSLAWVVAIPGTQEWGPVPATDPFDLTAGVTALAAGPTAASALVVRALDLAGARAGEPVLLAGHSLGGMLAAQLAADPAVRARFSVTCVVTAGSPVARYAVPASVAVLSLEHADDLVPALDGAVNPDRAGWVTVRRPSGADELPPDPGGAHDAGAYAATGALVDASADPSLAAWRAALAPFVAGPGVTAVRTVVTGRRARRGSGSATGSLRESATR
jgi:pimeloyl-ACP methyl ester carboxylesterase